MAVALRPAVGLIVLASALFLVTGWLDLSATVMLSAVESWAFGLVNLLVAVLIARGNERILALRIGLAAFFVIERPATAIILGPKPVPSLALHLVTALVEAVIFFSTMRVWRLGHSVTGSDLAFLTLPVAPSPALAGATAGGPVEAAATLEALPSAKGRAPRSPRVAVGVAPLISVRAGWAIGALALLLALALVADGAAAGIVPGVTVDLASPAWLVYLFALAILGVATRAVHGRRLALRLMLVIALITFVERAFTPFVLPIESSASLALHGAGALLALALAILVAGAVRSTRAPRQRRPLPL